VGDPFRSIGLSGPARAGDEAAGRQGRGRDGRAQSGGGRGRGRLDPCGWSGSTAISPVTWTTAACPAG